MEESMRDIEFEETKGLGTFFSHVDADELEVTTEMVFLPTLANNSTMVSTYLLIMYMLRSLLQL